jgi:phage gp29-like protein
MNDKTNPLTSDRVTAEGDGQTTPVFNEVAIIARQLILGSFDRLLPADDTLLTRGGGNANGLKLYDELERDPKVWETLQKRKLALTSRNWKVEPPEGDTSRAAKKAADMVTAQFTAMGFDQITTSMLDATLKGISTHEVMWQRDGREIVAEELIEVEPWIFQFKLNPDPDEYQFARCGVRLLTPRNSADGEKVPHRKFLIHRFGGKYNNPWGLGLGTRLFWPVFFKRQGIQFWLAFAERFGSPVPVGKYPNNATPGEKATLRAALRAFQQEASIMVPQGMEITLLEAAKSGIDTYERLCRYMDDQSGGVVLGKSGGQGSGGQLAASINIENEVRLELTKADADLLSDTLRRQLVRWIVDYNMPGAPYPNVRRVIEEPSDMEKMARTKKALFDMGFRPTLESIKQDFGGDYTEIEPRVPGTNVAQQSNALATPDFSEPETPADQAAVDALLASLAGDHLQGLAAKMLAPIIKGVRESSNHQAALEKLVELFPDVPLDDLQQSLASALFVVDTIGRLAVQQETES